MTRENYVIVERPPIAEFTSFDDWTCVGTPMVFNDMSTAATSWHWDFGDGGTSNDQNPYHVYQAAGVYTVTLTATNRCGEDTRVKTDYITVHALPVADFTADVTEVCVGATVSFSNLSSNETSWHWEFGDGNTSSVENPTHVYSIPGQYTVSLKVSNICGDDTESKAQYISVEVPPMADFESNTRQVCEGGTVNFDDRSYRATSWHWEFGDGSTSDLQNPSHLYTTAGSYAVTLHVSNRCGDDTEDRHNYIRVIGGPTAEFEAPVTNTCVGWEIGFFNYSQNATSWLWDFGDGATSTDSVGHHLYAHPGTYAVSLTAINACGDDTRTRTNYIVVRGYPEAEFSVDKRESCVGATVTFTDQSIDADSWHWDFGDGGTSTDQNPTHAYSSPGVYTVTLSVRNDCGPDSEIKTDYVTVGHPPMADFDTEIREYCVGGSVSFFNRSMNATSYLWNFGDGTTSTSMNPSHTYTIAGVYSVSLVATNACGSDTVMRENYITVDPLPVADFTAEPREGCAELLVSFTDLSTEADSWQWNFGDGTGSSSQNPDHTYAQPGSYTVTLTVTNDCGSDDAVKEAFIVVHGGPMADFSFEYATQGCTSQEVRFSDHSTGATSWNWDFGDGASSTDQHPTHTYTSGGTFLVTLTVNNACGDASTSREVVVVFGPPPVADFTAEETEVCEGEAVHFTNQSRNAYFWSWDFGDGQTSNDRDPSHGYSVAGSYTITLTVTNECGSDSETKVNYVTVQAGPVANFSATPVSGQAPLIVTFTDQSTSIMGITSWSWDFGDGNTSSAQSPSHTYTAPGTYTVTLTVVDACGDDKAVKEEYVRVSSDCEVDFSAEPTEGCAPVRVFFSGLATEDCEISSWTWDFGDPTSGNNNTATGQSAQHVYATTGTYTVKLTAVDVSGTKVVTKPNFVTVWGGPTAAFNATPTSGPAPLLVSFTDQSLAGRGTLSWSWNFGDPASGSANTSTQQHPSHSYYDEGTYLVSLIVVDDCGTDTAETTIEVSPAISITKAVDKAVAPAGDDLLYSVTIYNNGPSPVANIVVVDTIPDSSGFIVGSITGGGTYDANGDRVTWNLASLGGGAQATLEFAVVLDGPFTQFPTIVSNQAFATIGIEETALSGRTFASNIVETVVDIPTGVIGLQKDVSATLAVPSDELIYTITVENPNPSPAADVIIYDAVPDSTTYIIGSATAGGVYNPANDSLTWNLGVLAAFSSRSVSFRVTVDPNCVDGQLIPNTALVRSSLGGEESNRVITAISLTPIVVTKKVNRPSGMIGDLVKYTVTVENYSGVLFEDVLLSDTMPAGIFCVDGTSLLDGSSTNDPTGDQSLQWALGDLPASGVLTLEYTALISTSAHPGINENVVRAEAYQGGVLTHSNRAIAQIYVLSQTLAGAIRGRVIVDCNGDGVADFDSPPPGVVGTNVYLDDGSQSCVNEKGMFFFSMVRAGERVVALDERKLEGFYIPDGAQASVFVHVHETGESYVTFRICPDYPHLDIQKKASIVPTVKVTKRATLDPEQPGDSMGVKVDYEIDIKSNGLADPTQVRVVDSLPVNTHLILAQSEELAPTHDGDQLVYEVTAAQERLKKSVTYSLRELTPGVRKFLTNRVYLEGDLAPRGTESKPVVSEPVEVSVGPFLLVPPQDVVITLTPALFITSLADLQPPAIPQLHAAADSIMKYADADVKVEGHTDFRPIHTVRFPSNWELGEARAKSVVDWLVENRGIDPGRMTYESFAATKPVVTDVPRTSVALQPNRRTEVHIKTRVGGFLAPGVKAGDQWENSTSLALDPVKFDTLFEVVQTPVDIDLGDSWEVLLTVENDGAMSANDVVLTDIMPDGSEYLSNSAMVDCRSIEAKVTGQTISFDLKQIEPSQKLELRYRIKALEGRTPSGGGAASVEVKSSTNLPVIQKSNEVRFK
ncbi:MAG: PKD domain-containing protein [candidate division Zixibacteria bacterium]|nr:PKD domain-containing protein [candidate division Zixibacteria bacterium]